MNLYAESNKGVYKSSGRAFNKAFRPFITKFAMLIEESMGNEEVAECVNENRVWQEFKKVRLKPLKDQENVNLGRDDSQRKKDPSSEDDEYDPDSKNTDKGKKVDAEEDAPEKVHLDDMAMSTTDETLVEPKVSSEYNDNMYWGRGASEPGNSIEDLEEEYE